MNYFWILTIKHIFWVIFSLQIFMAWNEIEKEGGGHRLMMNDFVIIILSRPGGKDSY